MSDPYALDDTVVQMRELCQRLKSDIELASTRAEHVRLTARANEARLIYDALYTVHVQNLI